MINKLELTDNEFISIIEGYRSLLVSYIDNLRELHELKKGLKQNG
jgi:hypothetical protein